MTSTLTTFFMASDGSTRLRFIGPRDWSAENATDVLLEQARADAQTSP